MTTETEKEWELHRLTRANAVLRTKLALAEADNVALRVEHKRLDRSFARRIEAVMSRAWDYVPRSRK